jgi:hypothetical protein
VLIRRHPSNCKATDGGGSGLQFQRHSLADRGDDLYETPPVVVRALLRVEKLPHFSRRRNILESGDLARVYVFRNRLPMMHRFGWSGPLASFATAYAWFVWDRAHSGPTVLHRTSWMPAPANDRGPA